MTRIVEVPAHFDDKSFEQFAAALATNLEAPERVLIDAHAAQWASPYGLITMLTAAHPLVPACSTIF